jgi:N-acetylmuramoyl-L-alanine amidase
MVFYLFLVLQFFRAICVGIWFLFIFHTDYTTTNSDTVNKEWIVSVEDYSPAETSIDIVTDLIVRNKAVKNDLYLSDEEIQLIALITMAEAEGECEEGKILVIDTILNRVDSEYFPDSVYDVIHQANQFSSVYDGRVSRCNVDNYICELVESEARMRTNSDVIFFTAGRYSKYGTPMFQVEHHYFSSYK